MAITLVWVFLRSFSKLFDNYKLEAETDFNNNCSHKQINNIWLNYIYGWLGLGLGYKKIMEVVFLIGKDQQTIKLLHHILCLQFPVT